MIYLDHHAQSPMSAEVREAVERARAIAWANPSSVHAAGRAARAILESAREQIATAIAAKPADIVLTSGGTEACNLAVLSARRIVTTEIEHPAIAEPIAAREREGATVIRLSVARGVPFDPSELARVLEKEPTDLVAIQWINHETGTVLPVPEYARVCGSTPLVVDATAALGRIAIDAEASGASAIAIASSKVGGPPGAGALWVRRGIDLAPVLRGGAQERGRRAGTLDVAAMSGFGAACARLGHWLDAMPRVAVLRDRLEEALLSLGAIVNGDADRSASVVNVSVPEKRGALLVAALDLEGVCASSGAACSSGLDQPSPVILAMYKDELWRATSALRLSLAPSTTDADIEGAIRALARVLART